MMNPSIHHSRPYKLSHQNLCISNINFENQSISGVVELHIYVLPQKDVKKIKLNCKQSRLHHVSIEDIECTFTYSDPTQDISQVDKQRTIDVFSTSHLSCIHSVDPDRGNGEVIIQIPEKDVIKTLINSGNTLKLLVEFSVDKPLGGIQFVVPEGDGTLAERSAHMFTYGYENSSRLWFPCIDSYSEPCTWRMEFTVDADMTAVSCGDLVEMVFTENQKKKTFHYHLSTPTSAPNIALAVGPFELYVDPYMHEVTHFCLPHLLPHLKDTCKFLHEAFEFYEELLSSRYPYSCYKQVFVDEAYEEAQTFATMTILSTNLLHSKHIIDQTYVTRRILSNSIAKQFFGCFITMNAWSDSWLMRGISHYIAYQYHKKAFGNNEYRYVLLMQMQEVIAYEQKYGPIILDPKKPKDVNTKALIDYASYYFPIRHLQTLSPMYDKAHQIKSHLVIRMLEDRLGRELLLQVFNKIIAFALQGAQQKFSSGASAQWHNVLLSTDSFLDRIFQVTGKRMNSFFDQWVFQGGHAKFHGSFVFNRKRNTVELEIKQLETTSIGIKRYVGPLMVTVQELDGTFKHNLQIEENMTKHDITCHSKSRRNKKKKIPLATGEEVDMDLSHMDTDSPVLWIRIDPDMQILRQVEFSQPDYQWQYQLKYERDVIAQIEAIDFLEKFPTPQTRNALTDIINNEQCFYRVRCDATICLRKVANAMVNSWSGQPAMLFIFKKLFGSRSSSDIIKLNNFSNLQHYFLQTAIPIAMAGLRTTHGICPQEVLKFLFSLFKYNDNSKNKFSDNYYRAALIDALSDTVTPIVTAVFAPGSQQITPEALPPDTKSILEEITRCFNLDKLLQCYRYTVTISCLKAFRHMQKMGHLPSNPAFFRQYASYGVFIDIRKAALEALVDITRAEIRKDDLDFLLDLVEHDPVPDIKLFILDRLVSNPPFTKTQQNALNTEELVDRLWRLMNTNTFYDSKIRNSVADLYFTLYGRGRPSCLPKPEFSVVLNLKEKKATVSQSLVPEENSNQKKDEVMEIDRDLLDVVDESFEEEKAISNEIISDVHMKESSDDKRMDEEDLPLVKDESDKSVTHDSPEVIEENSPLVEPSLSPAVTQEEHEHEPQATQAPVVHHEPLIFRPNISKSLVDSASEEKSSKKDKDDGSHKRHKDKKKKKKHKNKHKHKHKHHSDKERHSHDRPGSSNGSTNQSPAKYGHRSP